MPTIPNTWFIGTGTYSTSSRSMENAFLSALPFSPKEDALLTMALGTPVEPDENTMIGLSAEQLGNERPSSEAAFLDQVLYEGDRRAGAAGGKHPRVGSRLLRLEAGIGR